MFYAEAEELEATAGTVVTKDFKKPKGGPLNLRLVSLRAVSGAPYTYFIRCQGYLTDEIKESRIIGVFNVVVPNLYMRPITVFRDSQDWPDNHKLRIRLQTQVSPTTLFYNVGYDIIEPEPKKKRWW